MEPVVHVESIIEVADAILDRLLGEVELGTDLVVIEALGHEMKDFLVAAREGQLFAARSGYCAWRGHGTWCGGAVWSWWLLILAAVSAVYQLGRNAG